MVNQRLTDIFKEMAKYVQATHYVVVDRSIGTVDIRDKETNESDFFLQGNDADDFIMVADDNWRDAGGVTREEADCSVAKPWIDCL